MSKYELATKETLLRLAEERDKYKKALEDLLPLAAEGEEAYNIIKEALNRTQQ